MQEEQAEVESGNDATRDSRIVVGIDGSNASLTALVQQMLSSLMADGKGDLDHSAIAQISESLSRVEVKRP